MKRHYELILFVVIGFIAATMIAFSGEVPAMILSGEVPPIGVQEFTSSPEASLIWQILAGQGTWGALIFAVVGLLWKFAKPYLDAWIASKRLNTLYSFAQTAFMSTKQTYTDNIKAASADGILTEEEAKEAMQRSKEVFIALCKTQGIDVVKEYGIEFIEWLLEKFVGDSKLVEAAISPFSKSSSEPVPEPPLPDLSSLQPFAQQSAMSKGTQKGSK